MGLNGTFAWKMLRSYVLSLRMLRLVEMSSVKKYFYKQNLASYTQNRKCSEWCHKINLCYTETHRHTDTLTLPPAMHSFHKGNSPSLEVNKSLIVKFIVSLMAFSGTTPIN